MALPVFYFLLGFFCCGPVLLHILPRVVLFCGKICLSAFKVFKFVSKIKCAMITTTDFDNKQVFLKTEVGQIVGTPVRCNHVIIVFSLEGEMKVAFVDAFNQINENFNRTFSELFGGGSAEISLTDPDDVLGSGIEIKAAPPGKIIKNMVQLSGGEQAFIAIALFFAILQVNPTPFCILDEIEAALDEVNVVRLAEYIKRYSGGTQFVMITHRRGTMEAANRLYGVTMPERGISKVLELDVNEISKKKGEDWDGIFGQA